MMSSLYSVKWLSKPENVCEKPIELTEQSFYHEGVRAVAFFPNIRLAPHQTTAVTILADKPLEEQPR